MDKKQKEYIKRLLRELCQNKKELKETIEQINYYCNIVNSTPMRALTEEELQDFTKLDIEKVKLWRKITLIESAIELTRKHDDDNTPEIVTFYCVNKNSRVATAQRFDYSEEAIKIKLDNAYQVMFSKLPKDL